MSGFVCVLNNNRNKTKPFCALRECAGQASYKINKQQPPGMEHAYSSTQTYKKNKQARIHIARPRVRRSPGIKVWS
jgi:hypothetical protein